MPGVNQSCPRCKARPVEIAWANFDHSVKDESEIQLSKGDAEDEKDKGDAEDKDKADADDKDKSDAEDKDKGDTEDDKDKADAEADKGEAERDAD